MLKNLILVFTLIIFIIIATIVYLQYEVKSEKLNQILDQVTFSLKKKLKEEQLSALEIAIVLSKNQEIVTALENDDDELGHTIVSSIMKTLKQNVPGTIRTQIITADLYILARSWDEMYSGMPLEMYRTDLNYFKTHKNPRTSIEVGRRLGIKATVPIYKQGVLLGFVEVIDFFEKVTDYFRSQGIDLYVLLDDKFSDTAILMRENSTVDNYIIANRNYNKSHMQFLKNIDFKSLKVNRIFSKNNRHVFYTTMHDGSGESIGAYLFVLPDKYVGYFRESKDDISFFINTTRNDLYDIEKLKRANSQFKNLKSLELLNLKSIIAKEDNQEYKSELIKRFDAYSKEELIRMLLKDNSLKKVNGKIR